MRVQNGVVHMVKRFGEDRLGGSKSVVMVGIKEHRK